MNEGLHNKTQFDYFSHNYQKFEDDFYKYSKVNIPLTFLTDDILKMMVSTGRTYFRLNRNNTKDGKDHYFIFKIHYPKENNQVQLYEYLGHRFQLTRC